MALPFPEQLTMVGVEIMVAMDVLGKTTSHTYRQYLLQKIDQLTIYASTQIRGVYVSTNLPT